MDLSFYFLESPGDSMLPGFPMTNPKALDMKQPGDFIVIGGSIVHSIVYPPQ